MIFHLASRNGPKGVFFSLVYVIKIGSFRARAVRSDKGVKRAPRNARPPAVPTAPPIEEDIPVVDADPLSVTRKRKTAGEGAAPAVTPVTSRATRATMRRVRPTVEPMEVDDPYVTDVPSPMSALSNVFNRASVQPTLRHLLFTNSGTDCFLISIVQLFRSISLMLPQWNGELPDYNGFFKAFFSFVHSRSSRLVGVAEVRELRSKLCPIAGISMDAQESADQVIERVLERLREVPAFFELFSTKYTFTTRCECCGLIWVRRCWSTSKKTYPFLEPC